MVLWAEFTPGGTVRFLDRHYADGAGGLRLAEAARACATMELVCPECRGRIAPWSGSARARAHFKHLRDDRTTSACPRPSPMSAEHRAAQEHIMDALQRGHPHAALVLEQFVSADATGRTGRCDIALDLDPIALGSRRRLCVEVQRSTLPVGDLTDRSRSREDRGYAVEWVFIGRRVGANSVVCPELISAVLRLRGYAYLLDDVAADEPALHVVVHRLLVREAAHRPDLGDPVAQELRDLNRLRIGRSRAHVLPTSLAVHEFRYTGGLEQPGAAGLRHPRLHPTLAELVKSHREFRASARSSPPNRRHPIEQVSLHKLAPHEARALLERTREEAETHAADQCLALRQAQVAARAEQDRAVEAEARLRAAPRVRRRRRKELALAADHAERRAADQSDRLLQAVAAAARAELLLRETISAVEGHRLAGAASEAARSAGLRRRGSGSSADADTDPARALSERWLRSLPGAPRDGTDR